jgi:hypothetical protein
MTCAKLAVYLNAAGLIFDMGGVIALYFSTIKGLGQIARPTSFGTFQHRAERVGGNAMDEAFRNLWKKINEVIDDTNKTNAATQKRSTKWLILIIIGFLLQLVSTLIQF